MDDSLPPPIPSASDAPPIPSQPVRRSLPPHLHADFDIVQRSMDPGRRNASRPDYNEDSRSFKMLMDDFT